MSSTIELSWFKSSYSGDSSGDCVEVALDWRKSSYSSSGDGDCVEVALNWHKSSYSSGSSGDCLEVAVCPATVHIRDSKNPQGPALALAPAAWRDFIAYAPTAGT
ncbi:DUF397 domain-containing protein [Streptomyces sp. NPDC005562]|uniref:DUF397 domain-containing protein n=1 Tax=unclassified Streptomyces TaxID=2593676 RepID=UPI0033BC56AE